MSDDGGVGALKTWKAKIAAYKARIKAGEKLTKDEEENLDFLEQKLEDWETDGENSY